MGLFALKRGVMKENTIKKGSQRMIQQNLFGAHGNRLKGSMFISVYRVSLVKDESISFGHRKLNNSQEAQSLIQSLIKTQGQPDREQFCVILLNAKNAVMGLNIVSIGGLSSTSVLPREVLKPAIIANSAAMVLSHNHPSNDLEPSSNDLFITRRIVQASELIGITVHEHIIISMDDDRYYSFADNGLIGKFYDEIH
jgi:DNA repair protein RadC